MSIQEMVQALYNKEIGGGNSLIIPKLYLYNSSMARADGCGSGWGSGNSSGEIVFNIENFSKLSIETGTCTIVGYTDETAYINNNETIISPTNNIYDIENYKIIKFAYSVSTTIDQFLLGGHGASAVSRTASSSITLTNIIFY